MIRADFLTPHYDITFSGNADPYKRRRKEDEYADLCMVPDDTLDKIVFLGGKDYLPLFGTLTAKIRSPKIVFYNSSNSPRSKGCRLERFVTTTRTNWHYKCANALIDGRIRV